jgi:hypothetical protein
VSDLNRDCTWDCLIQKGFNKIDEVVIDHVWIAMRFCTVKMAPSVQVFEETEIITFNDDTIINDIPETVGSRKDRAFTRAVNL